MLLQRRLILLLMDPLNITGPRMQSQIGTTWMLRTTPMRRTFITTAIGSDMIQAAMMRITISIILLSMDTSRAGLDLRTCGG